MEEIGDGGRYYGREQKRTTFEGCRALVTYRVTKTIRDGWWTASLVQESVLILEQPSGAPITAYFSMKK